MRQTGLMCCAMLLLRGITIRDPDLRLMAAHRLFAKQDMMPLFPKG
jgi:hypothetical protein